MHTIPYTDKPTEQDDLPAPAQTPGAKYGRLPLRSEVPDYPICNLPQKDMSKTFGGKITDFIIYQGLGFGGNSSVSVGITYFLNSKPGVEKFRKSAHAKAQGAFKDFLPHEAISNGVEIGFMLVAGTILTAVMAPLVNRREQIAYKINKMFGKDKDVLPENERKYGNPTTLEDKIELELKNRVNYCQTSNDLWKARWTGIWIPVFGDMGLGKWNAKREADVSPATPYGKWSIDTISWKAGQHLYDKVLPAGAIEKMGNFFKKHKAGIEDVKVNNPKTYARLLKSETFHDDFNQKMLGQKEPVSEAVRNDRMMIADQTRLLGKEIGWTYILSGIVENLTKRFQSQRIHKQELKAIAKMREEGIIPAGVVVHTDRDGHVKLSTTKIYEPYVIPGSAHEGATPAAEISAETRKWADDKVKKVVADAVLKSENHINALEKSRATATQPQIG